MPAPSAGSFSMVLVEDRAWTRRVAELDLWCDDREVPVNLPDTYNHWLGGIYMRQEAPRPSRDAPTELIARVALSIGDGCLVGIVSPYEAREPAIWFSIALVDILMVQVIARHWLTWRPRMISIDVPGWSFTFVKVAQHDGSMEWRGHERSLLQALGGSTSWLKRLAVVKRLHGRR